MHSPTMGRSANGRIIGRLGQVHSVLAVKPGGLNRPAPLASATCPPRFAGPLVYGRRQLIALPTSDKHCVTPVGVCHGRQFSRLFHVHSLEKLAVIRFPVTAIREFYFGDKEDHVLSPCIQCDSLGGNFNRGSRIHSDKHIHPRTRFACPRSPMPSQCGSQ
jgi:hypothetical protein